MDPDRRWWWIAGGIAAILVVLVVLIVVLSGDDDDSVTTGTSDTVPAFTLAPSTTPPLTTAAPTTPPTTAAPTTVPATEPPPPSTEEPTTTVAEQPVDMLLATDAGLVRIRGDERTTLTHEPASVAVEVEGTVYFQTLSGAGGPAVDGKQTAIKWIDPTGAKTLISPPEGARLVLHDAAIAADGHPKLLYSSQRGSTPPEGGDPWTEELFLYDVTTAATADLGVIGGWEFGTSRLVLAASVIVGTWGAEADHGLFLVDHHGQDIADPGRYGLDADYVACNDCPSTFGTDAQGARLAWVDSNHLVIVDLASGDRLGEIQIPADAYSSTQLVGHWALLDRAELPALLVDLASGAITQLPATGTATLVAG